MKRMTSVSLHLFVGNVNDHQRQICKRGTSLEYRDCSLSASANATAVAKGLAIASQGVVSSHPTSVITSAAVYLAVYMHRSHAFNCQ